MIASEDLSLSFKGNREYVHGTNMLNATMEAIEQRGKGKSIRNLSFSINKMTSRKLVCSWWEKEHPSIPEGAPIANYIFDLDGVPHEGKLVETDDGITGRVPFDESLITRSCEFSAVEKRVALIEARSEFSPIEILVSMNKALHFNVFTISNDSQWVFCRWESFAWPLTHEMAGISITMEQSFGTRLTRSRVELNNELVGRLYFSARQSGT